MQALLYRAKTIGTISEDSYQRTTRRMSAAGWRTKEPVEIPPPGRAAPMIVFGSERVLRCC